MIQWSELILIRKSPETLRPHRLRNRYASDVIEIYKASEVGFFFWYYPTRCVWVLCTLLLPPKHNKFLANSWLLDCLILISILWQHLSADMRPSSGLIRAK